MEWVDVQVALAITALVVPIWLIRREWDTFLRLLRSWGLPAPRPGDEVPELDPDALVPDVELLGARARREPSGLQVAVDLVARDRLAKKAEVKLGVLDASGGPYPVPPETRWVRFSDDVETLGGALDTSFATRSEMRWPDLALTIPATSFPAGKVPAQLLLRVEVWIDGSKEASERRPLVVEGVGEEPGEAPPAT